jgi:hypothetical protein
MMPGVTAFLTILSRFRYLADGSHSILNVCCKVGGRGRRAGSENIVLKWDLVVCIQDQRELTAKR